MKLHKNPIKGHNTTAWLCISSTYHDTDTLSVAYTVIPRYPNHHRIVKAAKERLVWPSFTSHAEKGAG